MRNKRGALSLGEMMMFAAYFLTGTLILSAALHTYTTIYPLMMQARLTAACSSVAEILDTAYSTGHTEANLSYELGKLGEAGITIVRGTETRNLTAETGSLGRHYNATCQTHVAGRIYKSADSAATVFEVYKE